MDLSRVLQDRQLIAYVLNALGYLSCTKGDYEQATIRYKECYPLLREIGDTGVMPITLSGWGQALIALGEYERSLALCEEGLALARELGSPDRIAGSLTDLAIVVLEVGDYERAKALCEESLTIRQQIGDKGGSAHSLSVLGRLALQQDDMERATRCYQESLDLRQQTGEKEGIATAVEGLATVATIRGQTRSAAQLYGAASALRDTMGTPLLPTERAFYEDSVAALRSDLNETAFTTAWTEGQAMPLEQAIAIALQVQEQFIPPQEPPITLASSNIPHAGKYRTNPFGLTARELEVLQLVSLGLTDAQIAEKLVISPRTVEAHVRSLLNKLGVNSRTSATSSAIAHNLVSLDIDQESVQ